MAMGRQRAEWLRVGVMVAAIVNRNGWTTDPLDPIAVIPPAYRPPAPPPFPKSPDQAAVESKRAWHVVDKFFGRGGR
jgi:hypothetical protein